jgi:hypothetical protein
MANYQRSYATGLIWLLQGRRVVALTDSTAAISKHRQCHPIGDSLDDFFEPQNYRRPSAAIKSGKSVAVGTEGRCQENS